jgi:adenylate kinase family enzyme
MQHLIIIRGNSGSGKTTAACALREKMLELFGLGSTMMVPQDTVRRDILGIKDTSENPSIELIKTICDYGMNVGQNVILDGILDRRKYGEMLNRLISGWNGQVHVFYYDIPLEITLERHDTRPQKDQFTKAQMSEWYNGDNLLGVPGERVFTAEVSADEAVRIILEEIAGD